MKNEGAAPDCKETPKGLQIWREAVSKCETAAQLAMCVYMLETAVAWDKSIMKAVSTVCWSVFCHKCMVLCSVSIVQYMDSVCLRIRSQS